MRPELTFSKHLGADIAAVFEPLAELRVAVFRDFPYLYEGTLAYEKTYLKTYSQSDRALLFAVWHQGQMIGATTCIPLLDETPEVQAPFLAANMAPGEIFYFGESILLLPYRGLGLGHRFFEEREQHAARYPEYAYTCFCAVERPPDHPLRPAGYRPLDEFWGKRGYRKQAHLQTRFSWPDIGETQSTEKPMSFWMKPIPK